MDEFHGLQDLHATLVVVDEDYVSAYELFDENDVKIMQDDAMNVIVGCIMDEDDMDASFWI